RRPRQRRADAGRQRSGHDPAHHRPGESGVRECPPGTSQSQRRQSVRHSPDPADHDGAGTASRNDRPATGPLRQLSMKTITGILGLCLLLALPAQADDQARLDALKAEISKLESWLRNAQQESGQLNAALRQSDLEIAELTKQINAIRTQLTEEQARLKKLRQEQGQLRDLQQQHRQHLAEQIRAAQKMGQQGPLKLLLNQDDPQQAQRMLHYFSY